MRVSEGLRGFIDRLRRHGYHPRPCWPALAGPPLLAPVPARTGKRVGVWRSLVAHLLWEQGVGGSNPSTPTIYWLAQGDAVLSGLRGSSAKHLGN